MISSYKYYIWPIPNFFNYLEFYRNFWLKLLSIKSMITFWLKLHPLQLIFQKKGWALLLFLFVVNVSLADKIESSIYEEEIEFISHDPSHLDQDDPILIKGKV